SSSPTSWATMSWGSTRAARRTSEHATRSHRISFNGAWSIGFLSRESSLQSAAENSRVRDRVGSAMGNHRNTKTEHTGAKNGGGFHGTREDAKKTSKRARRENDKAEAVYEKPPEDLVEFVEERTKYIE